MRVLSTIAVAVLSDYYAISVAQAEEFIAGMLYGLIQKDELYERLKKAGVLVVSGHYFFPGLQEEWKHKDECLRITYSQDDDDVRKGLEIIAQVVRNAYETKTCCSMS